VAIKEVTDRLPTYSWDLITARMRRDLPVRETCGAVTIYRVGFGWGWVDKFLLPINGCLRAVSLHRRAHYRVMWSMMASQASVAAAFFKLFARRTKLVLTLQEGDEESHLRRYVLGIKILYTIMIRPWHGLVFRQANYVTAISEHLKQRALRMGVKVPVEVIPNGVDLTLFVPPQTVPKHNGVHVVTTSRLVKKNAVEDIIRALVFLPDTYRLTIAGSGPLEKQLKKIAHDIGVGSRVEFVGHITHSKTAELLATADVYVRPSLSEGLGNSFLEAMAMRVPVVATPVGGIVDFVRDEETGLFCKTNNPEDCAEKIKRCAEDSMLRKKIIEAGYALIHTRYEWGTISAAMKERAFRVAERSIAVVIAASIYPPDSGGPALHAKKYFEEFSERGYDTHVIALSSYRRFPMGIRHFLYFVRLFVRTVGADVVYAMDPLGVGVVAMYVSRFARVKLMVRSGGDVVWERAAEKGDTTLPMMQYYISGAFRKNKRYPTCKKVLSAASIVVVPSELLALVYRDYYAVPEQKFALIPNPLPRVNTARATYPGDRSIVFASRLVAYKNLDFVLRSFAAVYPRIAPAKLVVLGDGPEKQRLMKASVRYGIKDSVEFAGNVTENEVLHRAESCSIGLAAAFTEFNPNFIMQCLALGKPFLMSRENGMPFRVPDMMLFDPRNREEFERKLETIMSPTGYASARNALCVIGFEMSWDDVLAAHDQLFGELCAS